MPTADADTFERAIERDELPDGQGVMVEIGTRVIALFERGGDIHAVQNTCPHAGGSLADGSLDGTMVRCPRHNWGFDVASGACVTDPRYKLLRFEVRIEDGWVLVGIPEEDATSQ